MATTMIGSYSTESGIGVETRCLNFNMHWDGFPLTSKFYCKLIQWKNELVPRIYIKNHIFNASIAPEWFNDRKIVNFKFGFIQTSYIKEFLGELVDDDPREPGYSCFKVVMFKVREGTGTFYYPLKASKYGGTSVGLQDDQRMGLDENSFNQETGLIYYQEFPGNLVWEFYFGYINLTDIWSPDENTNPLIKIRNPMYMSIYNFNCATIESEITDVTFTPLFTPKQKITIYTETKPTWLQILSDPLVIPKGDTGTWNFNVKAIEPKENGMLPIQMASDDPFYRTYNERIKIIAGRTFYIVNVRTSIDGDIYVLSFNIIDFKVVNQFGLELATIELGGSTEFFIKIIPDGRLDMLPTDVNIYFQFDNQYPHLIKMPDVIAYPERDITGARTEPSFISTSYGLTGDVDEFEVKISTLSSNFYYNRIENIPAIQVNIANIFINTNKVLIDIYDYVNPNFSADVQILPRRLSDITEVLKLEAIIVASTATFVTFNYTSTFANNEFIIMESASGATELTEFNYQNPIISKQGDVLLIDTSDPSNFGQKITFYDGNTNYSEELKDENGEILAQYSRTYPQGTPNSSVSIRLPLDKTTVYYRNQPINPKQAYWVYGFGEVQLSTLTYLSIGDITFTDIDGTTEGGRMSLISNDNQGQIDIRMSVADNDLFAETNIGTITARTIKVTPPIDLNYEIFDDNNVHLSWSVEEIGKSLYDFADPTLTRYATTVTFEILRLTFITGEPTYEVVGISEKAEYIDETAIRYTNYRYKIRAIIEWEGVIVRSNMSDFLFVFVCQNNAFPYGRWTNGTNNPKLYKPLNGVCNTINQVTRFPLAGPLFPNAAQMSQKEIYTMLAKNQSRPTR
jgi:hypothetical protein|uniref:Uncharacterized protein n=1 Tax=viral metagenome TaxID=1070528 RepID=A0A6C0IPY8_9ZZZZ